MSAPYLFVRGLSYFCGIGQSKEYTAEPQLLKLIKNDIINKTEDWFEYFSERKTKFYLDWDKNVDHPVKNCHIIESYKECLVKINEIVRYVKSIYNLDVSFKTATRTGDGYYVKEKKDKSLESGYKISLRFYFNFSIKYTEIPDFLRKLKQDEFWDIKPYNKKNQKLNLIGCVKSNKDERILLPFDGKKIMKKYDPEEYIVQLTKSCVGFVKIENQKDTKEIPKKLKQTKTIDSPDINYKFIKKIIENRLLDDYADDYNYWTLIGLTLKTVLGNEGFYLFNKFSEASYKYNEHECTKTWDTYNPNGSLTLGTIKYYAKKTNESLYFQLLNEYYPLKFSSIFTEGPMKINEFIKDDIMHFIIFKDENLYIFDTKSGMWNYHKNARSLIVKHCQGLIVEEIEQLLSLEPEGEKRDEKIKNLNLIKRKIDTRPFKIEIEEHLINELRTKHKNAMDNIFDNTNGKIVFKNGIYQLDTGEFTEGFKYNDYITKTLAYDFTSEVDEKDIKWILQRITEICNNNQEDTDNLLSILGYALTGYADREQYGFVFYGPSAANGKTFIFELLKRIFPIYTKELEAKTFLENNGKLHKEIILLEGKRFIWQDETPKGRLNAEVLKSIINGTAISVEKLYGANVNIPISGKLFFPTNNSFNIQADEGIIRRFVVLDFLSKFYASQEDWERNRCNVPEERRFIQDKDLMKKFLEKKMAFVHILIAYAKRYCESGLQMKKDSVNISEDFMEDDEGLNSLIINEYITINVKQTKNEWVTSKKAMCDLVGEKITGNFNFRDIIDFFKSLNVKYDKSKFRGNRGDPKGCFIGVKKN